jgi:hypothetical protein
MRRETFFCVQAFSRKGDTLQEVKLLRFTSATEAETVCGKLQPHVAGVAIYELEGDAEHEVWGEPTLWAAVGDVPRQVRAK